MALSFEEYREFDAVGLAELVKSGKVTSLEVLEAAIEAAERLNPALNAIVTAMYDEARRVAATGPSGPLAGVPFLIKDLYLVNGVACTQGSRLWKGYVADHDAEIVTRYRNAGLVIFGKTNTPEVGLTATTESVMLGACHNPWDLSRTTGGSSGGAASAVAAGILPAAHATDGGGSIRIPASCCGLVGLKPTRARTSSGPDSGEGWGGMSTGHAVSRTVRDSAALLDAVHGPAPGDPYYAPYFAGSYLGQHTASPGKLKIAIDLNPINEAKVHPECRKAVENAAKLCGQLGHQVDEVNLPYDRAAVGQAAGLLVVANVRNTILARANVIGVQPSLENIEALTLEFVEMGAHFTADTYAASVQVIQRASRWIEGFFSGYDLIMSPTLVCPPVPLGYLDTNSPDRETYTQRFNEFWGFTSLYNATGNPAISLPLHWTGDNLPVGVQFAASFGNELLLLQLANQLEQAQPWSDKRPRA